MEHEVEEENSRQKVRKDVIDGSGPMNASF
jgi:hypothetical protein